MDWLALMECRLDWRPARIRRRAIGRYLSPTMPDISAANKGAREAAPGTGARSRRNVPELLLMLRLAAHVGGFRLHKTVRGKHDQRGRP